MSSPLENSLLGQTLNGRYRLNEVRLRGIFGTVFLAEDFFCRTFVRRVLVKVSRQTGMTEVTAPHFFDDAIRLAQLLADPTQAARQHLPAVLDLGLLPQGGGILVTEACVGTPLLAWQAQGQRPDLATQLKHFQDLCRTLASLHGHGIFDRELRPDAVIVDAAGNVRLLGLGMAAAADWPQAVAEAAPELVAHLAPETLEGQSGPQADVYALGLLLYEWLTGGGPHLTAPWGPTGGRNTNELNRLKQSLHFPPPSVLRGEIRQAMPWLDDVVLRCLAFDPTRRFHDAGKFLDAIQACAAGAALAPPASDSPSPQRSPTWAPLRRSDDPAEQLIREARRLMAHGEFDLAIDRLDIHRPAEWTVVDYQGAQVLRLLGQAYVRRGDWRSARECLEQLRSVQREQSLLAAPYFAAALTDLWRSYTQLDLKDQAEGIRQEARQLRLP
jgi:serine/threonine protein kinase